MISKVLLNIVFCGFVFTSYSLCAGEIGGMAKGNVRAPLNTEKTTFDRIDSALSGKTITLKDSVILKAKALFAPGLLVNSVFQPQKGEIVNNDSLTGYYKDVHRVFDDLSNKEKELLKPMSPDLKVIIEQREKEKNNTLPRKRPAKPAATRTSPGSRPAFAVPAAK